MLKTSRMITVAALGLGTLLVAPLSLAVPINGSGLLTHDVIFGAGNQNGGFTGVFSNGIELGLRAKQRYPVAEIYNYDSDHTYTFDSSILTTNPVNRSVFNFEWSINTEATGLQVGAFDYILEVDKDPLTSTDFSGPNNTVNPYLYLVSKDHSFGTPATTTSNGVEAADLATWQALLDNSVMTVSQQSWNLGFLGFSSDPDLPGIYSINLSVFEKGTVNSLANTSIDVRVLPLPAVPVSEPATLPILMTGFGLMVMYRRRQSSKG